MQIHSHHMQDLHLVQVCFRLVQICARYFFLYRGSFRFRFALSTRAQGVPFLHTIGRTSNHSVSWCYRCGGSIAPYTPFYGHTPCMIDYTNIILFAW